MDGTARLGHFRELALTLSHGAFGSYRLSHDRRIGSLLAALAKPRMTVTVTAAVTDHKLVPVWGERTSNTEGSFVMVIAYCCETSMARSIFLNLVSRLT
jgi:hypothetical protein